MLNFRHSLCASVSSPSRALMRMDGIAIEASFNDKNFEVLHVFILHQAHEKGEKYEIEMTKIDQECYLCRRFSP